MFLLVWTLDMRSSWHWWFWMKRPDTPPSQGVSLSLYLSFLCLFFLSLSLSFHIDKHWQNEETWHSCFLGCWHMKLTLPPSFNVWKREFCCFWHWILTSIFLFQFLRYAAISMLVNLATFALYILESILWFIKKSKWLIKKVPQTCRKEHRQWSQNV